MNLKGIRKFVSTALSRPVDEKKSDGNVWIEKSKYVSEQEHKVRIHTRDGKSDVRYVSDEELELLHKEPHVTKVVAL